MKAVVSSLCFLLLFRVVAKNDLVRQKLNGRVKSVTNCQCPLRRDGKVDSAWCMTYTFKYDDRGLQFEDNDYTGSNIFLGYGTLNHKRLYRHDADGNQTEVEEYDAHGKLTQRVVYRYDVAGNRTGRLNYNADGALWYRSEFTYDSLGNCKECSKYTPDSVLQEHYSYAYDARGNLIFEQHVMLRPQRKEDAGHTPGNKEYSAEKTARVMDFVKTYVYDDSDRKISENDNIANFAQPFESFFRYENYDVQGNWHRQVTIENGRPNSITDRIIEYYP